MRLHTLFPFHTIANDESSHCAFSSRARDLADMLTDAGCEVFAYANEGADTKAKLVPMLTREEHAQHYPPLGPTEMHDSQANLGSDGWKLFHDRARAALKENLKPGDIVLHCFDDSHASFLRQFPEAIHVSPVVGNGTRPFGSVRIFESEAWRHYCLGRFETMRNPYDGSLVYAGSPSLSRNLSWSIPNARDEKEWPLGDGSGDYALFMGRICDQKGVGRIAEMVRMWERKHPDDGLRFVFAGQGDFDRVASMAMKGNADLARRLEYVGSVTGTARAKLVGNARCMLAPTLYVEPGGGSAVESLLTGTPVLASAYGCFTESVIHGVNGYLCRTPADWIAGLEYSGRLSRRTIAELARQQHSFEAAAPRFLKVFRQLELLLTGDETTSLDVP